MLFLDHDLGGEVYVDTGREDTGSEVARWLSQHPEFIPNQVVLHSHNDGGVKNMYSLLKPHTKRVYIEPFMLTPYWKDIKKRRDNG